MKRMRVAASATIAFLFVAFTMEPATADDGVHGTEVWRFVP
jgi:hypothetical protein